MLDPVLHPAQGVWGIHLQQPVGLMSERNQVVVKPVLCPELPKVAPDRAIPALVAVQRQRSSECRAVQDETLGGIWRRAAGVIPAPLSDRPSRYRVVVRQAVCKP